MIKPKAGEFSVQNLTPETQGSQQILTGHLHKTEKDQISIYGDFKVQSEELKKEPTSRDQMVKVFDKKLFTFENLSIQDIKNYTNLTKDAFLALDELLEKFRPFNYWSGSEVTQTSDKNQLLICLIKLKLDVLRFLLTSI